VNRAFFNFAVKSSSTLGLLKRNLSKCPQKLQKQAYISLIRSRRLEYCTAVWDPYLKDINTLEGIQRRAARFVIQDHSRFTSVSSLLKDLNWAPLKDRMQDIRSERCAHPHRRDTRKWSDDYRTTLCFKKKFTLLLFAITKSDVDRFQ